MFTFLFSSLRSTLLLAFPNFNWQRFFRILSMIDEKLFEIFCNSLTKSGRLPLSSLGVTESTRLVGLKCFLKWSRIFSGEHFTGAGFKVDSCFVARETSLSNSLVDRRLIDLSSFCFKIFIFLKKELPWSLIYSRVFDSSLELAFLAFCKLFIF